MEQMSASMRRMYGRKLEQIRQERPAPAEIARKWREENTKYINYITVSDGMDDFWGDRIAQAYTSREAYATYAAEVGVDVRADYSEAIDLDALASQRFRAMETPKNEEEAETW